MVVWCRVSCCLEPSSNGKGFASTDSVNRKIGQTWRRNKIIIKFGTNPVPQLSQSLGCCAPISMVDSTATVKVVGQCDQNIIKGQSFCFGKSVTSSECLFLNCESGLPSIHPSAPLNRTIQEQWPVTRKSLSLESQEGFHCNRLITEWPLIDLIAGDER